MLDVTSGSELFWNRRNWTVRKGYTMWIWIQLPSKKECMRILVKKSTFDLPWNYLTLCERQLASLKKLKMRELKNSKIEVSLKLYLKRIRFIEETIYSRTLHQSPLQMLKVFLAIVDNFNWHFFLSGNRSGPHFS